MKQFIKKRFKLIILALVVAVVGVGGYYMIWGKKTASASKVTEYTATKKSIDVAISGSGEVSSTSRQDVSSEVQGTIVKVFHQEGDKVNAGEALFQLDDSNAASTVQRTQMSISQAEESVNKVNDSIANLSVTTPISGQVSNISINKGDNVNSNQEICTITDTSNLKLTVPFNVTQIKNIYVGESADIFLQDYMDTVKGTVTYVSNAGKMVAGGGSLYNVEIALSNPGSVISGSKASAKIGELYSVDSGSIQYASIQKVRAKTSGTVENININDGQQIYAGQVVVSLSNDDLASQLEDAKLKVQDLQVQLASQLKTQNNYKISAVIDGTIISQTAKVGDVVSTQSTSSLAVVTNPNEMQFDISVDELDIAKISVGMSANVTLDALPGKNFEGVVSKIAGTGTSSSGVTTYPVTVVIKNPSGIREGMNANADIQIQHKDNVLTIPLNAAQKMGNRYFVFVKGTGTSGSNNQANQWSSSRNNQSSGSSSNTKQNSQNSNSRRSGFGGNNLSGNSNSRMQKKLQSLGSDVSMKMIEVGINNDEDIEVISGLSEGDKIVVPVTTTSTTTTQQQGFGMMGGMSGGPNMGGNRNYSNRNSSSNNSSSKSSGSQSNSGGGNRD